MSNILVFDNCNIEMVKKVARVTAKRLLKKLDTSLENEAEPTIFIEAEGLKSIVIRYYDSTKFRTNRTFVSISYMTSINDGVASIVIPFLDKTTSVFKTVIKQADPSVCLVEEYEHVDITNSIKKALYKHIFEIEAELIEKDINNVRNADEETNSERRNYTDNAGRHNSTQSVPEGRVNWKRILSIASSVVTLLFICLYNFGVFDYSRGGRNQTYNNYSSSRKWIGSWGKDGNVWIILNSDNSARVQYGGEYYQYDTRWEDSGEYVVIGARRGEVIKALLMGKDGKLYHMDYGGNISWITTLNRIK